MSVCPPAQLLFTYEQPSKSEYFTLKTEVLSEVTNKLMPDDILLKASPRTPSFFRWSPNVRNTVHDEDHEQSCRALEDAEAVHHSTCCDVLHDIYPLFDEPTSLAVSPVARDRSDRNERVTALHVQSSSDFCLERCCTVQVDTKPATVHRICIPRRHPCPEFDGNWTRLD